MELYNFTSMLIIDQVILASLLSDNSYADMESFKTAYIRRPLCTNAFRKGGKSMKMIRQQTAKRSTLAVTALELSLVAGIFGPSAEAAPPSHESNNGRIVRFDAHALRGASKSSDKIQSHEVWAWTHVQDHLDDAARQGRLVDEREVALATVADPFTPEEVITIVWDRGKAPHEVLYGKKEHESGSDHTILMDVRFGDGDTSGLPTQRNGEAHGGAGYSAVFRSDNMYREDNGCATTWFRPSYPSDYDHKLVSCYEVWGLDRTPIFVYNRWALWTPAPAPWWLGTPQTVDFEVSARPWRGHEGKIKQLADWAPRHGDLVKKCDTNGEFTLGGSWAGLSGSVTMPLNTCEQYWLNITAGPGTQNRMTIDFDGSREGQMYMDIAGKYDAIDQHVLPYWADRNYVQLQVCFPANCPDEYWEAKDSGW
jgi:hypothetical protein